MNLRINFQDKFSNEEKLTIVTKIKTIIDSQWNYHLFVKKCPQGIHVSDGIKECLLGIDEQRLKHA